MRKLYLLRHAEAPSAFDVDDFHRDLSEHGENQARNVGQYIENIDMVLASSAVRTRRTLETAIADRDPPDKIKLTDDLYNASAEKILTEIKEIDAQNLLIVAHNPGIHQLAFQLARDDGSQIYTSLSQGYPPCSLLILECDINDWSAIELYKNTPIDFLPGGQKI